MLNQLLLSQVPLPEDSLLPEYLITAPQNAPTATIITRWRLIRTLTPTEKFTWKANGPSSVLLCPFLLTVCDRLREQASPVPYVGNTLNSSSNLINLVVPLISMASVVQII